MNKIMVYLVSGRCWRTCSVVCVNSTCVGSIPSITIYGLTVYFSTDGQLAQQLHTPPPPSKSSKPRKPNNTHHSHKHSHYTRDDRHHQPSRSSTLAPQVFEHDACLTHGVVILFDLLGGGEEECVVFFECL